MAGVAITMLSGMAILIWNAGRHSQRLDAAEGRLKKIEATQEEHGRAISVFHQFSELLKEVRDDVKDLLTGKAPVRRRNSNDA